MQRCAVIDPIRLPASALCAAREVRRVPLLGAEKRMVCCHLHPAWLDHSKLYHTHSPGPALQVYERAISNVPPAPEKRYWQRYIYLWIKYALFEELEAGERQTKGHWLGSGTAECVASSWLA